MTAKRHQWTDAQLRYLVESYPNTDTAVMCKKLGLKPAQIHYRAGKLGISKSREFLSNAIRQRSIDKGRAVGEQTRFQAGHRTWNKGIPFHAGGRSAETRFKPRHLPHNYKPMGSERVTKNGYLQRKMTETGYPPRDWVFVHHIVWKEAGLEIPKGFALCFIDGNKANIALENLTLVSRKDLMRRNGYHNFGPEMAKVVQLRGAIARQINKHERNHANEQQQ